MRILVTGGAGFVGSNLVDKLVGEGHDVTVWDNYVTGKPENVSKNAKLFCLDVSQPLPDADVDFEIIFHMAALARIQPSFAYPERTSAANVDGTYNMLELARKVGAKFIYPGSSSFYHDVYANPYTFTKWIGEEYCKLYSKVYGLSTVIARFFNVYGPKQIEDGAYATVIGIFEKQRRTGLPLTVTGTGEKRRDFTHVFDIVDGLIALSRDKWQGEIFNFGTGRNYSINEVATLFEPKEIVYLPNRPGEAEVTLADISESRRVLGYEPQHNLESYIKTFVQSLDSDTQ